MKTFKFLFAILAVTLLFSGCAYNFILPEEEAPPPNPDEPTISFSEDIIPIFEASCNDGGCHNGTIAPNLTRDVAYVNLVGGGYVVPGTPAEDNTLYQVIHNGSMQGFASDCERTFIKQWLDEGALNN